MADDVTLHLYNILWNIADLLPGYSMINKGANSNDDWNAKKVINLPTFEDRTLTYFSDALQIGKLIGASNYTIGINNVEPHDHGGGIHNHTGQTYNSNPHPSPGRTFSGFVNPMTSNSTGFVLGSNMGWSHQGFSSLSHNHSLQINNSGKIISTQGGGQPLHFKEPSLHIQRLLYLGWK